MTTIAWDGTTLAGDRQTSWGNTPTPTTKVFRVVRDGYPVIFGCAGLTYDCDSYKRWAFGEITERPAFTELAVMLIDHRRRLWFTTEKMIWSRINAPVWACGSGSDYALGAMHAGADAVQAIRIATKLDFQTGLGVTTVRLNADA